MSLELKLMSAHRARSVDNLGVEAVNSDGSKIVSIGHTLSLCTFDLEYG
jgi:hypothetical protein